MFHALLLLRGKSRALLFIPIPATPSSTARITARLGTAARLRAISPARSLPPVLALARSSSRAHCAARRGGSGLAGIYTCTRDIIAASSRHAALVRSGSPRALLPSSRGRRRERKKRERRRAVGEKGRDLRREKEVFQLVSDLPREIFSTAKIVGKSRSTVINQPRINCNRRSIATASCAR